MSTPEETAGYALVWRDFGNTWVREQAYHVRRNFDPILSIGYVHFLPIHEIYGVTQPNLNKFLRGGWPVPSPGSRFSAHYHAFIVYMDDLFLCPQCGCFRLANENPRPAWISNAEEAERTIHDRRHATEFALSDCPNSERCTTARQKVFKWMKLNGYPMPGSETSKKQAAERPPEQPKKVVSWRELVYLIRMEHCVKIGVSRDPSMRIRTLATASPFPVVLLKSWKSENAREAEQRLHAKFESFHAKLEWFNLPQEVLQELMLVEHIDDYLGID